MATGFGIFAPSLEGHKAHGGKVVQTKHPAGDPGTKYSLEQMGKFIQEGRNDPRMRAWASCCVYRKEAQQLAQSLSGRAWLEQDRTSNGWTVRASTSSGVLAEVTAPQQAQAWIEIGTRLRAQGGRAPRLTSATDQAQAVLDEVRRVTLYVQDPVGTEMIVAPQRSLCLDDQGLCMTAADCDDRCVIFATGTLALGIETRVLGQSYDKGRATHVICAICDEKGRWQKVDPSSADFPVGKSYPATRDWWLDPVTGKLSNSEAETSMTQAGEADGDYVGVGGLPRGMGQGVVTAPGGAAVPQLATVWNPQDALVFAQQVDQFWQANNGAVAACPTALEPQQIVNFQQNYLSWEEYYVPILSGYWAASGWANVEFWLDIDQLRAFQGQAIGWFDLLKAGGCKTLAAVSPPAQPAPGGYTWPSADLVGTVVVAGLVAGGVYLAWPWLAEWRAEKAKRP